MHKAGLYLHIPFCVKKCAYCNFYSTFASSPLKEDYLRALEGELIKWGGLSDRPIDTIYIGGGTPSVLGKDISPLLDRVYKSFKVLPDAEITAEVNPGTALGDFLSAAKKSGVNRISVGIQSFNDDELKTLGRTHTANDAIQAVENIKDAGFKNISADIMLGLPNSSIKSIEKSLTEMVKLSIQHISAYILKIEENTLFGKKKDLSLPDDDTVAEQYIFMCEFLKNAGFGHYEISNFSLSGFESRHNLKYWKLSEYIGIGPSAHSFLDGKRSYYEADLKSFITSPKIIADGTGGGEGERIMLGLRLKEGVALNTPIPAALNARLHTLKSLGLIEMNHNRVSLTDSGMLVSNSIINEITEFYYEDL